VKYRDSELWSKAADMAREGLEPTAAFRKIRGEGGRDLVKSDEEWEGLYRRLQGQPLFAAHMVLTLRRSEFLDDVEKATLGLEPADALADVDYLMTTLEEFKKGSFQAMLTLIGRVRIEKPATADLLMTAAKALWPSPFAQMEARDAAAAQPDADADHQLPLPFERELAADVAGVPA
jgi:hypothetical protein